MEKLIEPKTIVYDYLFNYFGGDSYKGKIVLGACVQLAIRAYKNDVEIKFNEEPRYENIFWCDNYTVSFDEQELFIVKKNIRVDNLFRIWYEFDKIEAEVVGYTLDIISSLPEDIRNDLPEMLKDMPCSEPMEVSEEEFKEFLAIHKCDFNISDNMKAQVPSVAFV